MAHFAKLDADNLVIDVLVVANEDILVDGEESEEAGVQFLENLTAHSSWKQTSYNNNIRGRYAGIGYSYDPERDLFIQPQPFPSWVYNEATLNWLSPTAYPGTEGEHPPQYYWDEETVSWKAKE
jgi:hypothetical protein